MSFLDKARGMSAEQMQKMHDAEWRKAKQLQVELQERFEELEKLDDMVFEQLMKELKKERPQVFCNSGAVLGNFTAENNKEAFMPLRDFE
jgi:hypothetical protein